MQTKDTEDFDLAIRSLLEDAEVKPSRRVWKAVSARLQEQAAPVAEPAPAPSFGWMRWAGLCTAFAAIALGVFLFTGSPEGNTPAVTTQLPKASQEAPALLSQALPEPAPATEPVAPAVEPASAPVTPAAPAPVAQPAVEPAPAPVQPSAEAPAPAPVTEPAAVEPAEPAVEPAPAEEYVPLNWEEAPVKASKPIQLYAQGSLLGNESDFSVRRSSSYGSSGVSTSKTGVIELGESSYGIPFSLGLGVRFYLIPKLALGTGLDYSFLSRSFNGKYVNVSQGINETGDVAHSMHYLGIPLNLSYDFVSTSRLRIYAQAGGEAEYCVSNKYKVTGASAVYDYSSPTKGLQWSVGVGAGVEFLFTKWLGIYLDPGIRYYFDCNQPKNIRTEKPVIVNFNAGLRFGF